MTNANEPISPTIINYDDGKPLNNYQVGNTTEHVSGLTKREYFAAMAMQGLWSSVRNEYYTEYEKIASMAVKQADALINELNK